MEKFVSSIRTSIEEKNWYAALSLALTMPDICGKLEHPNMTSGKRYAKWFDKYLGKEYTVNSLNKDNVFLDGAHCYSLRCSYLHQGEDDISEQKAKEVVNKFQFISVNNNWVIHNNKKISSIDGKKIIVLQLQVNIFCEQICKGVEEWLEEMIKKDKQFNNKCQNLLFIQEIDTSKGFSF